LSIVLDNELTSPYWNLRKGSFVIDVNVSLSGNNSKRGSSSARGSSFPSQDKSRKMIIDGGNKGGPKKFSVPRSKQGRSRGGKRANPSTSDLFHEMRNPRERNSLMTTLVLTFSGVLLRLEYEYETVE
jgi:hypothetical protein